MKDQIPDPTPPSMIDTTRNEDEDQVQADQGARTSELGLSNIEPDARPSSSSSPILTAGRSETVDVPRQDQDTNTPSSQGASHDPVVPLSSADPSIEAVSQTTTTATAIPLIVDPQSQHMQRRQSPMWIDGLIVAGLAILVMLLYRKISNPSNLIETVSL